MSMILACRRIPDHTPVLRGMGDGPAWRKLPRWTQRPRCSLQYARYVRAPRQDPSGGRVMRGGCRSSARRNPQLDARPSAGPVLRVDPSSVRLGDAPGEGEAETESARAVPRRGAAVERIEDALQLLGRDSFSGVRPRQHRFRAFAARLDADGLLGPAAVLARIVEKVVERPREKPLVALE